MKKRVTKVDLKEDTLLQIILDEYCEDIENVPTDEGKAFFREWNTKIPPKLVRQCIYAGIYWAIKHPDTVLINKTD